MRSASWWLEWPVGPIRLGVVLVAATSVAAVLVTYPGLLHDLGDDASQNSALSYADREIAGGNGLVADQQAVYAARGFIPEDATYHVAVDPRFEGGDELTVDHVASYYRYFLMPRRPAEKAPWIVCYGCDLAAYGPSAEVLWRSDDGTISVVKVPE